MKDKFHCFLIMIDVLNLQLRRWQMTTGRIVLTLEGSCYSQALNNEWIFIASMFRSRACICKG